MKLQWVRPPLAPRGTRVGQTPHCFRRREPMWVVDDQVRAYQHRCEMK